MALDATQFQAWLEDTSAVRCLLVQAQFHNGTTEETVYFSNKNYMADATGKSGIHPIAAGTFFNPIVNTGLEYTESISLDGSVSISFGDISIDNTNGVNDAYLNYVWVNRPIKMFMGDPLKHTTDDFTLVFNGYVSDIASSDSNSINVRLRDLLQRINCSVTSATVGSLPTNHASNLTGNTYTYSTSQNKDVVMPLVFGEVFNITPVLIDPTNLIYMVHNGPIEGIIEVRDNGVNLTANTNYTVDLTRGLFRLLTMNAGTITCSVQGAKPSAYLNTAGTLIQHIVKTYGTEVLVDDNIDTTTFTTFNSANTQPVGIYLTDKSNVLEVCQQLASSVGAQILGNRIGLLSIVKLDVPTTGAYIINEEHILQDTFSISEKVEVKPAVKLGVAKNWTPQTNLSTGIPQASKDILSREYITVALDDAVIVARYKLSNQPEQKDTLLLASGGSTITEATRLLNMFKVPRFLYGMDCTSKAINIVLGQMITLYYYRFGMVNGVAAQVVSVSTNWDTGITKLEVFV
jgi:hypothetical protein